MNPNEKKSPEIDTVQSHNHPQSSKIRYSYRKINPDANIFLDIPVVFYMYYGQFDIRKYIASHLQTYHVARV